MSKKELLPDEPLSKKLVSKGFWLYFFSFVIAPLGYCIRILLSGDLSVEEVGVLYGVVGFVTLCTAYNDLGMTESLKYYIPLYIVEKRFDKVKTVLTYSLSVQIFTGCILACFFYFGSGWLAANYFQSETAIFVLKAFAFYFFGYNFFQIVLTFFLATQNTFHAKAIEFVRMLGIALGVVSLFFSGSGSLITYSVAWLVGLYCSLLFAVGLFYVSFYKKYFKGHSLSLQSGLLSEVSRYAFMVFLGTSVGTILGQLDLQMVIYMLGTEGGGYYTNYLSILGISGIVIGPIFMVLFPIFSELHAKKEVSKIAQLKGILTSNFSRIAVAFSSFFFVFAKPVAFVLFGNKFLTSGMILQYSILLLFFNLAMQLNMNLLAGLGKVKERLNVIYIGVAFNVIANYILISFIGLYGAALATGLGRIVMRYLSEKTLGKSLSSVIHRRTLALNLLCFIGLSVMIVSTGLDTFSFSSRINDLRILAAFFFLYLMVFIAVNYRDFTTYFVAVRKMIASR